MIFEEIFYHKELCDSIRDIVLNSATTFDNAVIYLRNSKDYDRDSFIIKKLSNCGIGSNHILITINGINS